jgi:hypothetical protein
MRTGKGWLQSQMRSAKKEVGNWQGWKRDTLRNEVSRRLSSGDRGELAVSRSAATGRWVVKERKK